MYHEGRILGIFNYVKISLENEQTPGYFIDVSKFSECLETVKHGHTSSVQTRKKTGCFSNKNSKRCNVLKWIRHLEIQKLNLTLRIWFVNYLRPCIKLVRWRQQFHVQSVRIYIDFFHFSVLSFSLILFIIH